MPSCGSGGADIDGGEGGCGGNGRGGDCDGYGDYGSGGGCIVVVFGVQACVRWHGRSGCSLYGSGQHGRSISFWFRQLEITPVFDSGNRDGVGWDFQFMVKCT